jgi:hypothetical protein
MGGGRLDRAPDAPDSGSNEELKRNRRRVFVVGAAVLLAMGVVGKNSWFPNAFHIGSSSRAKGPVVIDAQQVYDAYRNDAHAAAKRFRHREMVVSGEFVRIVPDGQGNPDLRLKTSDPEAPLGADLAPISYDQAARLTPGQRVTVSCQRITGSDDDRWLQNCAIQSVAGSKVVVQPATPAGNPPPSPSPADGNRG